MRAPLLLLVFASLTLAQGARDPWSRLKAMDKDGDGKVARGEFDGPARLFDRMDGDGDGFVTEKEARARQGGRGGDASPGLFTRLDTDRDGKVSAAEWEAFFEKTDENGDEALQPEEMAAALRGETYRDPAPEAGAATPAVKAKTLDGSREVDLSQCKRVTVLLFGSYT